MTVEENNSDSQSSTYVHHSLTYNLCLLYMGEQTGMGTSGEWYNSWNDPDNENIIFIFFKVE